MPSHGKDEDVGGMDAETQRPNHVGCLRRLAGQRGLKNSLMFGEVRFLGVWDSDAIPIQFCFQFTNCIDFGIQQIAVLLESLVSQARISRKG